MERVILRPETEEEQINKSIFSHFKIKEDDNEQEDRQQQQREGPLDANPVPTNLVLDPKAMYALKQAKKAYHQKKQIATLKRVKREGQPQKQELNIEKLKVATWNVDSLGGGGAKLLADKMSQHKVQICCAQDTKMVSASQKSRATQLRVGDKICYSARLSTGHSVSTLVDTDIPVLAIFGSHGGLATVFDLQGCYLIIYNCYAPVYAENQKRLEEIKQYWTMMNHEMRNVFCPGKPAMIMVCGDYNARIGAKDVAEFPGLFGSNLYHERSNHAGKMVTAFAEELNLAHPKSLRNHCNSAPLPTYESGGNKSEIDHILISAPFLDTVKSCKVKPWTFKAKHTHHPQVCVIKVSLIQVELAKDHQVRLKRGPILITYDLKKITYASRKLRAIEREEAEKRGLTEEKLDLKLEKEIAEIEAREEMYMENEDPQEEIVNPYLTFHTEKLEVSKARLYYDTLDGVFRQHGANWDKIQDEVKEVVNQFYPLKTQKRKTRKFEGGREIMLKEQCRDMTKVVLKAKRIGEKNLMRFFLAGWAEATKALSKNRTANNRPRGRRHKYENFNCEVKTEQGWVKVPIPYEKVEILCPHTKQKGVRLLQQTRQKMDEAQRIKVQRNRIAEEEIKPEQAKSQERYYAHLIKPIECGNTFGKKLEAAWRFQKILRGTKGGVSQKKQAIINPETKQKCTLAEDKCEAFAVFLTKLLGSEKQENLFQDENEFLSLPEVPIETLQDQPDRTRMLISKGLREKLAKPFEAQDVARQLMRCRPNKAVSMSGLSVDVMRAHPRRWGAWLLEFMNNGSGIPESWCCGWVAHLLKPDKVNEITESYRTVSILEGTYKVWSGLWANRLNWVTKELGYGLQTGNQPQLSCADTIASLQAFSARSTGENPTVVLLDLSKAFDRTIRKRLFQRLLEYGLPFTAVSQLRLGHEHTALHSYFDGKTSRKVNVNKGVFQGSPLSPVCFLLYCLRWQNQIREKVQQAELNRALTDEQSIETFSGTKHEGAHISIPDSKWEKWEAELTQEGQSLEKQALLNAFVDDTGAMCNNTDTAACVVKIAKVEGEPDDLEVNEGKTVILSRIELTDAQKEDFLDEVEIQLPRGHPDRNKIKANMFQTATRILGTEFNIKGFEGGSITIRKNSASGCFKRLRADMFYNRKMTAKLKGICYRAIIMSIFLYAAERHQISQAALQTMQAFINGHLGKMLHFHENTYLPSWHYNSDDQKQKAQDEEVDYGFDVQKAGQLFNIPSVLTLLSALDTNFLHTVAAREKFAMSTLWAMTLTTNETQGLEKNCRGCKSTFKENTDPLGGASKQHMAAVADGLLQKAEIRRKVEEGEITPQTDNTQPKPEEIEPDKGVTLQVWHERKENANLYRTYVRKCREEGFLHPNTNKIEDLEYVQLEKQWKDSEWLKEAVEAFHDPNEDENNYKFAKALLRYYSDNANNKQKVPKPWPIIFSDVTCEALKTPESAAESQREAKKDFCDGCNTRIKGAQGLAGHLARCWTRIELDDPLPTDQACINAYKDKYPAVELPAAGQVGRKKVNIGEPQSNVPWRKEPWKFRCPVPKEIANNCDFPQNKTTTTWCIWCRIRENHNPPGNLRRKEKLKEYQDKKKEHKEKTGKERVPHKPDQEKVQLEQTACPNGNQNCRYPIPEERQRWCISCKVLRGKKERPWEDQGPKAP